jgi:hypothetical protein
MAPRVAQLGQRCVSFAMPGPDPDSVRETTAWLHAIAGHHAPLPDPAALSRYSARAVAERQLEILASVLPA